MLHKKNQSIVNLTTLKLILALSRPHQYIKNLFVFLPAFFAFQIDTPAVFWKAFTAFIAFSLTASAVYILNDWKDREVDRRHPEKRFRPLASGKIGTSAACGGFLIFLVAGSSISLFFSLHVFFLIAFYFAINVAYSFKLKHISIVDIVVISTGFIVRLFVGAEATGVELSHWIIVMTFLLALFLSLAKRRDDVLLFLNTDRKTRKVIDGYNLKFLDSAMVMTSSIVILAYILWSLSPEISSRFSTDKIFLTSLFVIIGMLRYMQIAFVEERSGSPTKVFFNDLFIQLSLLGWLGTFIWLLYL